MSENTVYRFLKKNNLKSKDRTKPHKCNFDMNEIGNKYNWLTIIGVEYVDMYKTWCAKCKCDCGKYGVETLLKLKKGLRKTCGNKDCKYHIDLKISITI